MHFIMPASKAYLFDCLWNQVVKQICSILFYIPCFAE